jgi:hypothetical protein
MSSDNNAIALPAATWPRGIAAAACFVMVLVARPASADQIGITAVLGGYKSDNSLQVADPTASRGNLDDVVKMSVYTYGNKETARFKTDWTAGVAREMYSQDVLGNHNYYNVVWGLDAQIVPKRFQWRFEDTFGQILVAPGLPDTPLNRQGLNVFSTGPTIALPINSRTEFRAFAVARNSVYPDDRTAGATSREADIGFARSANERTEFGFHLATSEGEFINPGMQPYETEKAYFHFVAKGTVTTLKAEVGVNRALKPIATGTEPYLKLDIQKTLSTGSLLELSLSDQLTNSAEQFGTLARAQPPDQSVELNQFESVYELRTARLGYAKTQGRLELKFGVSARWEEPIGEPTVPDRYYKVFDASIYRVLGSKTGIRFYGTLTERRFDQGANRQDTDTETGFEIAKPFRSPVCRWVIDFSRYARNSTDPSAEYTEHRIGAYIRYSKFIFQRKRRDLQH